VCGVQTLGTYQSDHVAPPAEVQQLLGSSSWQAALGSNPYFVPQSFQFTHPDIFFQLDNLGAGLPLDHQTCREASPSPLSHAGEPRARLLLRAAKTLDIARWRATKRPEGGACMRWLGARRGTLRESISLGVVSFAGWQRQRRWMPKQDGDLNGGAACVARRHQAVSFQCLERPQRHAGVPPSRPQALRSQHNARPQVHLLW
jgi:hypothetical protein